MAPVKKKAISLATKKEILTAFKRGEKKAAISKRLDIHFNTISTICGRDQQKITETLKTTNEHIQSSTKIRPQIMNEMESLLILWVLDLNKQNFPLSRDNICAKAKSLYDSLCNSDLEKEMFCASRGWFEKFKGRAQLKNIKMKGEAADSEKAEANEFKNKILEIISEGEYSLKQIFNVDETGLNWKRMPTKTFVTLHNKSVPGHKISKQRITLLLGGNANGDYKLKPLLIHTSENPRSLKNVNKNKLGLHYKSNRKAWMTNDLFLEWIKKHLIKELKRYAEKENISYKFLILLDNAPGHAPHEVNKIDPNIQFVFMPPNTTAVIQPMDQGVISTFKSYYLRRTYQQILDKKRDDESVLKLWKDFKISDAIKHIVDSWNEMKPKALRGAWKKIIPSLLSTNEQLNEVECIDESNQVLLEISEQAQLIELEGFTMDELQEVLNSLHMLTNEELMQLSEEEKTDITESIESDETCDISLKNLKDFFNCVDDAKKVLLSIDKNSDRVEKTFDNIENSLEFYKQLQAEKQKKVSQSTLDFFISSCPRSEIDEDVFNSSI